MPEIEFVIDEYGDVTIEGFDFEDGECIKEIERYIKALGRAESRTAKAEHGRQVAVAKAKQRGKG
jgi:hypothetical protein